MSDAWTKYVEGRLVVGARLSSRSGEKTYVLTEFDDRRFIIQRPETGSEETITRKAINDTYERIQQRPLKFQAYAPDGISYTVAKEAGVLWALRDVIDVDEGVRLFRWRSREDVSASGARHELVVAERQRREGMWLQLVRDAGGLSTPRQIGDAGIRPAHTGQGIHRDSAATSHLHPSGVTLALLHTGKSYADQLSEDSVIYNYPKTNRRGDRDEHEVEATRAACELGLPVFVISGDGEKRRVQRGYVVDHSDRTEQFLVEFGEVPPTSRPSASLGEFSLKAPGERGRWSSSSAKRSSRFSFLVFERYGAECALCPVSVKQVLEAAHLCPVADGGSDDPRNGLVLCANHHKAMDEGLFGFDPQSTAVVWRDGCAPGGLGMIRADLAHLAAQPHPDAVACRRLS